MSRSLILWYGFPRIKRALWIEMALWTTTTTTTNNKAKERDELVAMASFSHASFIFYMLFVTWLLCLAVCLIVLPRRCIFRCLFQLLRYMILSLWFGLFFSVAAAKSHYENNLRDEEWRRPKFYTCVLRIEHPSFGLNTKWTTFDRVGFKMINKVIPYPL